VAVIVHWVRERGVIVDDDAIGGVGACVNDVPLRRGWVADIALVREQENWVIVVGAKRRAVHVPQPIGRGIGAGGHVDGDVGGWVAGLHPKGWDGKIEGIVSAARLWVWLRRGGGNGRRVGFVVIESGKGIRLVRGGTCDIGPDPVT